MSQRKISIDPVTIDTGKPPTMCAVVYYNYWTTDNPLRSFCAPGGLQARCIPNGVQTHGDIPCQQEDTLWYQKALYYAAHRADDGSVTGALRAHLVALSPGTIALQSILSGSWPVFKSGMHVPTGVHLTGANGILDETVIRPGACIANGSCGSGPFDTLILVSDSRSDILTLPVSDASVQRLTLNGSADAAPSCSTVVPESKMQTNDGVSVPYASSDILIQNLSIHNVAFSGINTGFFSQWVYEGSPLAAPALCSESPVCIGLRRFFSGASPSNPSVISYNTMCNTKGMGTIGRFVKIDHNAIHHPNQNDGTQAISFGFVGGHDIEVTNNVVSGAGGGIIADGSFPLYQPIKLLETYWNLAVSGSQPLNDVLKAKYLSMNGPFTRDAQGNAIELNYTGTQEEKFHDFLMFGQYVLDWGSRTYTGTDDGRIYNATISGTPIGISLYRNHNITISNNNNTAPEPLRVVESTNVIHD